ncbi:uncharacterized protein [Drosophila kikkawai]
MPKEISNAYAAGVAAGLALAAASGRKTIKKKNHRAVARRRLFLLVDMEVEAAEKDETINSRVFRNELIRIVKSDSEMERVLTIMNATIGIGCLEDRFFRAIRGNLKGFATAIGANK